MDSLIIRGGTRLDGALRASGSKNAALPILAATLLTAESCALQRVPLLKDVTTMMTLLSSLGAGVLRSKEGAVVVEGGSVQVFKAPYDLVKTMRASILVLGPLLARYGRAEVSFPGGCAIGSRPVDPIFVFWRRWVPMSKFEKAISWPTPPMAWSEWISLLIP